MRKNLLPLSITNFSKTHSDEIAKLKRDISDSLYMGYFLMILLFIAEAFIKLFLLLNPNKEPDYESIISFGERGTILIATLALLTFTYALALDNNTEKKEAVRKSGEYFLKSVLNFVIGLLFLIGFRDILTKPPSNTFGLPDFVIASPFFIGMLVLIFGGLAMLILSALYLAQGLIGLIKSLKNEKPDKVVK
ncbi:MAG: hypothetical protein OIN85_00350 [Candidatus Methanoperedens sp.]|nr:hypothetical protein [Candidatus Methanoperedens sp.]